MSGRTPEEREQARLEREARRAKNRGETSDSAAVAPVDPVRYDPVDFVTEPGEAEPTAMYDDAAVTPDPEVAGEPTVEFEPDFGAPPPRAAAPIAERPMGVKRLGKPSATGAGSVPVANRRGVVGAYDRYKAKPRGVPKQGRGFKRKGPIALLVVAVVLLWFLVSLFQPLHGGGSDSVQVEIPQGSTNGDVADILSDSDVIGSKFFFGLRTRMSGAKFQSGTFTLKKGMSFGAAIDAISGKKATPTTVKVVIPEGKSRRETAGVVKKDGLTGSYLAASKRSKGFDPSSYKAPKSATLEGFLFPATYDLKPRASTKTLVRMQVAAFATNFESVSLSRARKKNLTAFDVLTIASLIERETSVDSDRPKIAAVIYNRLKAGIPLGIDATVRYAVNNWKTPLKQSELNSDSPYNTRKFKGLPPGPIGSPGLASIKAAANPSNASYLYFVVKPCGKGTSNFSSTDAQFQKDQAEYNRVRAKNGGNDPSFAKNC